MKLKFFIVIFLFIFIFINFSHASAPLYVEYKTVYEKEINLQVENILDKTLGESISLVYEDNLMECQIKRYDDFKAVKYVRQIRCFIPCVYFIEDYDNNCLKLEDNENNYFIFTINQAKPNRISAILEHQEYSYQIKTEKIDDEYRFYFSKNEIKTGVNKGENEIYIEEDLIEYEEDFKSGYYLLIIILIIILFILIIRRINKKNN